MVDHVVDVHDITVTIKGRTILSNLSIQVEEGTFHGIIGPNGAGKTTLFNAIQGFRKPAQGSIELLGHSPYPRNLDLLTQIGIQPQRPAFFPHTTLREHLCAVADIYAVAASRVDDLIEALGLSHASRTRVEKLSGGERQRLAVATALVHRPAVLFLDEPTAGLDPEARAGLVSLLQSTDLLHMTTLYTTHHLDEAERLCDTVSIIENGRIIVSESPSTLIREADLGATVLLPNALHQADDIAALAGQSNVRVTRDGVSIRPTTQLACSPPCQTTTSTHAAPRSTKVASKTFTSNSQARIMSTKTRALTRVLLRDDLRDWSTLIFTFIFPSVLLVVLILTIADRVPGMDLTGEISSNVIAFGASFVGIFSGASHLATWRENGMFTVMRTFPLSSRTVLTCQARSGVVMLITQAALLVVVAVSMGMRLKVTALAAVIPLALGYLLFFTLGVLLGILLPAMAGVSMAANVIILGLGFLGGAIMPVTLLPHWAQIVAPWTPIYHLREAATMPLIGVGTWIKAGTGMAYLLGVTALLAIVSERTMRWE